jgi:poly-gamma-glutamate synthesis protein (capsule biosynthesis protein)
MTGRGIDQILPYPSEPAIPESDVHDAREYVELAERASGPIPRRVDPAYIWGDALDELEAASPDVRIVNLETSVTRNAAPWPAKGINYRMHPANVTCLTAAGIDVCALANNHVLDYGHAGLEETVATLSAAGLQTAGAGRGLAEAQRPAIVERPGRPRVIVLSFGTVTSGIPGAWSATAGRPGVDLLADLSNATADAIAERAGRVTRPGSFIVASIHWGGNWGYGVPRDHVRFAHRLIDGGIDVVHGHSSHHPRPIEVYRGRLVLYGCGDLIDDYEGIPGYEDFRGDLVLLYIAEVESTTGALVGMGMMPLRIHRMRLTRATAAEAAWLRDQMTRICGGFGSRVEMTPDRQLRLHWSAPPAT